MKYNMDNLVCMPKSNSTRVHVLKFQIKTFHPGGTRGLAGLAAALHRVRPPLSLSSELGGIRDSRAARIARSRKEKKTFREAGRSRAEEENAAADGGDGGGADDGEGHQGGVAVGSPPQAHPGSGRLQGGMAPQVRVCVRSNPENQFIHPE